MSSRLQRPPRRFVLRTLDDNRNVNNALREPVTSSGEDDNRPGPFARSFEASTTARTPGLGGASGRPAGRSHVGGAADLAVNIGAPPVTLQPELAADHGCC